MLPKNDKCCNGYRNIVETDSAITQIQDKAQCWNDTGCAYDLTQKTIRLFSFDQIYNKYKQKRNDRYSLPAKKQRSSAIFVTLIKIIQSPVKLCDNKQKQSRNMHKLHDVNSCFKPFDTIFLAMYFFISCKKNNV